MLNDSLTELCTIAKYCINTKKVSSTVKTQEECYFGFPAAIFLFTITDTVGSFYEGDSTFEIECESATVTIDGGGWQHFYILNSHYYGLNLSKEVIKEIYQAYRNLLIHNGSIPRDHFLAIGNTADEAFIIKKDKKGIYYPAKVNLLSFSRISEQAVNNFLNSLNKSENELIKRVLIGRIDQRSRALQDNIYIPHGSTGFTEYIVFKKDDNT
jgi:hypothetical protein